jgi:hypothetical protein
MNQARLANIGRVIEFELGAYVEKYGRIMSDKYSLDYVEETDQIIFTFEYYEHGWGRTEHKTEFTMPSDIEDLKKELDTVKAWLKLRWDDSRG